jgi:hypothetical protein
LWAWGLNSGPLLFESHLQSFYSGYFGYEGLENYLLRLALNHSPSPVNLQVARITNVN